MIRVMDKLRTGRWRGGRSVKEVLVGVRIRGGTLMGRVVEVFTAGVFGFGCN